MRTSEPKLTTSMHQTVLPMYKIITITTAITTIVIVVVVNIIKLSRS